MDLRNGSYDAYIVDDNLVIVHTNLNLKIDDNIRDWIWVYSGKSVGVDSGRFGFYDMDAIKKINDYENLNRKTKLKTLYMNMMPILKYSNKHANLVSVANLDNSMELTKQDKQQLKKIIPEPFGVISHTGTGDGFFDCYVIDDNRAVLIGGYTLE